MPAKAACIRTRRATRVALLRAFDKRDRRDAGAVEMPEKRDRMGDDFPGRRQAVIVLAVGGNVGAELVAYALP